MPEVTVRSDELDLVHARPVYTSIPEGVIDDGGFGTKFAIKKVLNLTPGRFWTASKLAKMCGYNTGGSQVELRKSITELIEFDHIPIVSNGRGFALATGPEMVNVYIENLFSRTLGIRRRIDAMNIIWKEMVGGEDR